jgi:aminoglycoside phosphotransferase (APT) family kinase protein
VRDRAGRVHPLVLRRFVDEEWRAEEPDAPRIEATALTRAASLPLPTPGLVALCETDAIPLLLMTRLPGSLVWQPADVEPYLRRLAAVLPELHAAAVDAELPPYEPYALTATHPPDDSQLWRRAFEIFHGPAPSDERRILHRDYHPGNVLWAGGTISGIVDWASARIGPPPVDAGHCRSNLVSSLGMAAADRFLAAWLSVAGRAEYDPYWDVVAVLGAAGRRSWCAWMRPTGRCFSARSPSVEPAGSRSPRAAARARRWRAAPQTGGTAGRAHDPGARSPAHGPR